MIRYYSRDLKRNTQFILILYLIPCIFALCYGQQRQVNRANQQWVQYYSTTRLSEQWNLLADASYRWKDGFDTRNQYLFRFGVSYKLLDGLQLGGGIAHSGSYGDDGLARVEFRPYQDIGFKNEYAYFDVTNRIRIEERFINPVENGRIQGSNSFNFRFRYSLSASIPLFMISAELPDRKVLLLVGDEIFLNGGKEVSTSVFDQNRILISPTLQWNKHFTVSLTWSSQYASTQEPFTYLHTDLIWLQIRQQFDASRKNKKL